MSRSYRKNPILKDGGKSSKENKQLANRRVRRVLNRNHDYEIKNGNAYRKINETWNINDYVSRFTEKEASDYYDSMIRSDNYWDRWFLEEYPTKEAWMKKYRKDYLYK